MSQAMTDTAETMVERVARALKANYEENPYAWHMDVKPERRFANIARAAIAAMAEPDDQTLWAIANAIQGPMGGSAFDAAKDAVKAFVQAALAEKPE